MEERRELQRGLRQLDGAIFFILLLIVSVLFSLWSMGLQRRQLLAALRGEDARGLPSALPLKRASSALVIGSLGFFLCLSLAALGRAGEGAAKRSAQVNALASTLALGAALLRFYDLLIEESGALSAAGQAQANDLPPA